MRPGLSLAVRDWFESGVDVDAAEALLAFVVGDALTDAGHELAQALVSRDVASHRATILEHGLLDAMNTSATIAQAFVCVGNAEAGAVELLRFLQALALDVDERARAAARRDALMLDRQVNAATRRCRWPGRPRTW